MILLQKLYHSNHEKVEQRVQLEEKEEEIEKLKNEISQGKEESCHKLEEEVVKLIKEVENSNTQLEEIKKSKQDLKIQLTRKENYYHMLELEIINSKKINESTNADLMNQIEEAKKN